MRVQIQEQRGAETIHHDSIPLVPQGPEGVTVAQVILALESLRQSSAIPSSEAARADRALRSAEEWARARPPTGVSGWQSKSFYFEPQATRTSFRFDIENLFGDNLKG